MHNLPKKAFFILLVLLSINSSCSKEESSSEDASTQEAIASQVTQQTIKQPKKQSISQGPTPVVIPPISDPLDTTAPEISAISDVVSNAAVSLSATVFDESPMQYSWQQSSGSGTLSFSNPTAVNTEVSADQDGLYSITFTALDTASLGSNISFDLLWDTTAPEVNTGKDIYTTNTSVSKTATVIEMNNYSVFWSQIDGPGTISFSDNNSLTTDITPSVDGSYTIRLTATDEAGNSSFDEFTFTKDDNAVSLDAGADLALKAEGSLLATVDDATGVTFMWSQQDGPGTISFGSPTSLGTTVSADQEGVYNLEITATKNGFQTINSLVLKWDLTSPLVNVGDDLQVRETTSINATSSDISTLSYQWSMISGPGTLTFGSPNSEDSTLSADTDGSYVVRLTAIDELLNESFDELTLEWDSTAPIVDAGSDVLDATSAVSVDATVSDASPVSYQWSIVSSDGPVSITGSQTEDPVVTPLGFGDYILRLTVTDSFGNSAYDDLLIHWGLFSYSWSLANTSNFLFDPTKIEVKNGMASLLATSPIDPIDSQLEFEAAGSTLTDVAWDNTGLKLNAAGLTAQTGTYISNVVDLGSALDVSRLTWTNDIPGPYQRNLPANGESDPASWGTDRIENMNGLMMLFHFNDDAGTTELIDSSGNIASTGDPMKASCTGSTCPLLNYRGRIGRGVEFDGVDDELTIPDDPANRISGDMSFSAWIKVEDNSFNYIIEKGDSDSCDNYAFLIYQKKASFEFSKGMTDNSSCDGSWTGWSETAAEMNVGEWYHLAVVYDHDNGDITFYRNGVVSGQYLGVTDRIAPTNQPVKIGRQSWGTETNPNYTGYFQGGLDELAVFSREITADEISKIYKRGLYRLDMQVRGCDDATCSTNPAWTGPDGGTNSNFYTYYKDDGTVVSELPITNITGKQYFQYKSVFTAPDQTISPELKSITVSSFDTSNPELTIQTSTLAFDTLTSFTEIVDSDHLGDVKYQLSLDNTNWYYFDSNNWVTATDGFTHSNFATDINSAISSFPTEIGTGNLYFKAFLNKGPGAGFIKLKGIKVEGTKN